MQTTTACPEVEHRAIKKDSKRWLALKLVGFTRGDRWPWEWRDCTCGSTLAIERVGFVWCAACRRAVAMVSGGKCGRCSGMVE